MSDILNFYNNIFVENAKRKITEVWKWDDDKLESNHDYIQWLFPSRIESKYNPLAPILSSDDILSIKRDSIVKKNIEISLRLMMNFYGWDFDKDYNIHRLDKPYVWISHPHNYERVSRILKFLVDVEMYHLSEIYFLSLCNTVRECVDKKMYPEYIDRLIYSFEKFWIQTQRYYLGKVCDNYKFMTSTVKTSSGETWSGEIGFIFHLGLYSVPAFYPVKEKGGLNNGSEWYLKRLMETGNFRPISGWKETQKYHLDNYGSKKYEDFINDFDLSKWDVDSWMKLCKDCGAKYVIITTKHHDGFCLWNTKSTEYNSMNSMSRRDIVMDFKLSAEKHGLDFGVYYSWSEFGKGCTKEYYNTIVDVQIKELVKYKPKVWFFDGQWSCTTVYSMNKSKELVKYIKDKISGAEINDRISGNKEEKEKYLDKKYLGVSTYRNYSDRFMVETNPGVKWEYIETIGYSWGYNKMQKEKHYKSGKQLYSLYRETSDKGGRFLLNLGPKSDGSLDEHEVKSLLEFRKYIK